LKGWHVLITGGSSGIGLEIAKTLAGQGAILHISARNAENLALAAAEIDGEVHTYVSDSANSKSRHQLMTELSKNTDGRLDCLVVNAASYSYAPLLQMQDEEVENYFLTNTLPAFALVRLAYPLLQAGEGKAVLFVSSTLASRPLTGVGAYAASKAAMNSLALSWSLELAGDGIRVNAVLPGVVNTPIHDPTNPDDPSRAEKLAQLAAAHPIGRVGEPKDIASAAHFLLSKEAAWVTGSLFYVDGGISLV